MADTQPEEPVENAEVADAAEPEETTAAAESADADEAGDATAPAAAANGEPMADVADAVEAADVSPNPDDASKKCDTRLAFQATATVRHHCDSPTRSVASRHRQLVVVTWVAAVDDIGPFCSCRAAVKLAGGGADPLEEPPHGSEVCCHMIARW